MKNKIDKEQKLTWKYVVKNALLELGGQGHLSDINRIVKGHPKTKSNPTWQDTIRRVVRQYKIFEPVLPERSGSYKLVDEIPIKTAQDTFTNELDINHGIAQGMLVVIGKIYGYETYVPPRDQTIRKFQGKTLKDFVSVRDCTDIFKGPNITKIREIDILWFIEDDYGLFPVYAFEVEETTGVKNGLDRLLKIPQRFRELKNFKSFIIAPTENEKSLFDKYINQTPFKAFKEEFIFRFYNELESLYNSAVTHSEKRQQFGIIER